MIKCTFKDLDRVRDSVPGPSGILPGPLTKLHQLSSSQPLLASRTRIMRLCRAVAAEVGEYEKTLSTLLKTYGEADPKNPAMFKIPLDKNADYEAEKAKLDESPCEVNYPSKLAYSDYDQIPLSAYDLDRLETFLQLPE